MKKYRIAYFGIFDIENYGDHLYPIIFKDEMEKRGLEFEMTYFSNYACDNTFSVNAHIHKYDEIDDMHKENPFDVIVVGGGSLIHPYKLSLLFGVDSNREEVEYQMLNIWLYPIVFSNKNKVKCIINSAGVPFELSENMPELSNLFNTCDYISVRNDASYQYIKRTGTLADVEKVPDSVFLISDTYLKEETKDYIKSINLNKDYIVFQCGSKIPHEEKEKLFVLFDNLAEKEYEIVFLPIAYTRGDDIFLTKLAKEYSKYNIITFDYKLNVKEIAAVIANCRMYIGLSMHGAVTALSYNNIAINYDYDKQLKIKQLFEDMNYSDYNAYSVEKIISLIDNRQTMDAFGIVIDKYKQRIKDHYSKIYSVIIGENTNNYKCNIDLYKVIAELFYQDVELNNIKKVMLDNSKTIFMQNDEIIQLKKITNDQADKIFVREDELKHVKGMLEEREELINDCKIDIQNRNETIEQLKNINSDLNNNYNNLIMQMGYLQNERDALESFRVEVINSKMFKLFHLFDKNAQ